MIIKSARTCITSQNIIDIIRESKANPPLKRGSIGQRLSPLGGLFWGDIEILELRPGLRIYTSDFRLENELEVTTAKPDQPVFCSILTMAGSWRVLFESGRGRSEELSVTANMNAAGIRLPKAYKTRLEGGLRHRYVRVDISTALLRQLIEETGTGANNDMNDMAYSHDSPAVGDRGILTPSLEYLAHEVIYCPMEGGARRLFLEGKALEIIAHQLHYFQGADHVLGGCLEPVEMEQFRRARSILDMEYADPPGLFELAHRVGLNDFKLKRGFKKCFGTTVFGYVRNLRMEKAQALLGRGELSVTEAAGEAGYRSLGHFAAAFKRRFGVLPGKYRKERSKLRL